jgi:hypothetical protein
MSEKLFETALGISAPWFVAGTDFNAGARTLMIRVDVAPGSRFAPLREWTASIRSTIRCPNGIGI